MVSGFVSVADFSLPYLLSSTRAFSTEAEPSLSGAFIRSSVSLNASRKESEKEKPFPEFYEIMSVKSFSMLFMTPL